MPKLQDEKPPFLKLFELFGGPFNVSGNEAHAEECPFCHKDKFYLNTVTGQYECKSSNTCGKKGNAYNFIRWHHKTCLEATTDEDYRPLKVARGLPLQTLKRHELAWDAANGCWLIPYKSESGEVLNLTRYFPENGRKFSLPGLPLRLFGLDQLQTDSSRMVLVCEGPFDAIALDQHLREKKTRKRYGILAVPSANTFKPEWLKHLKGRTVRLLFDNDKAGRDGQDRIAKLCRDAKHDSHLSLLKWPSDYPEKCDIGDLVRDRVNVIDFTHDNCVKAVVGERRIIFMRGDEIPEQSVTWMWKGHAQFKTFVSLSGLMGTMKSTVARDLAARATSGSSMPNCKESIDAFDVIYFTSEDSASVVRDHVRIAGGDLTRLHVHDIASSTDPIDFLDCLPEIEATIKLYHVRLVILDALNSFVGGDISTDSKARRSLSGRLQSLARRTGVCLIGIRNWGRMDSGSASQKSLGATSLSDVARCVMNTKEAQVEKGGPRRFQLEFEKVSDAPKPLPIPYSVENLSTGEDNSHHRRIVWQKRFDPVATQKWIDSLGKKKSSTKR